MPELKNDPSSEPDSEPRAAVHVSGPVPKRTARSEDPGISDSTLGELDEPMRAHQSARPSSEPGNDNAISGVRALDLASRLTSEESAGALENRLVALAEAELIPDSDAASLTNASDSIVNPKPASDAAASTRPHTHVPEDQWLDGYLDLPGNETDLRQRLAWRFKAAFTAWKLLLPTCSTPTLQTEMLEQMRRYERLLRSSGPADDSGTKQQSDALHLQLSEGKAGELDRALSELEGLLLSVDASISQEAFKARWNRDRADLRQLLRYARFLAARRFGIGYRRDRFETLATELLTAPQGSGRLLLMPRRRAIPVLRQLLRGLYRPSTTTPDHKQAISYLREALDRLDAIPDAKSFFDSGFYLDVYGYKISRHDRILSPEFLYLSVAIEVDVHNRLLEWSAPSAGESGKSPLPAALQLQLRAQKEAAQAVFADFHKPLAGSASPPKTAPAPAHKVKSKPATPAPRAATQPATDRWRIIAAAAFVLCAIGANLYVTGAIQLKAPPHVLLANELLALSPLLTNGRITADGKRLLGNVSRPRWNKLSPRERTHAAEQLAARLQQRGIEHAELLAYTGRAIQIDYGSVVYVDDTK